MKPLALILSLSFITFPLISKELDLSKVRDPISYINKVKQGFDVNAVRSSDGYTLMHFAAETGSVELLNLLIERGAEKNPKMDRGDTPLSTAISFDKKEIIRILLEVGVNPNYQLGIADYNRTHFHYYLAKARKIDRYIFEMFVKKGANLESTDSFGETPLMTLASVGTSLDGVQFLIGAKTNVSAQNKFGRTALMSAAFTKNESVIKALLASGAQLEQRDKEGNTVLIAVVKTGTGAGDEEKKLNVIKLLLKEGASPNAKNGEGNTVLHEAVISQSFLILEYLTSLQLDFNARNNKQVTALDQAIINENWEATKILLTVETDINGLDKYGSTRLHSAILNNKVELIKLLLNAGANKNVKDKYGKSAVEFAISLGNDEVIQVLNSFP